MSRAAAQASILADIEAILPGSENPGYYQALFAAMDDDAFQTWMAGLEDGTVMLNIIAPNVVIPDPAIPRLDTERNLDLAVKWGHSFFERIWMNDGDGPYLSNKPYLIYDLPVRRQAQLLSKKISVAEDSKSVDDFTGQPTGKSKGSKISYPEMQLLASQGLESSIIEMIKYRGGDVKGYAALIDSIAQTGGVSLKAIAPQAGGVTSTQSLRTILTAMHLSPTI